MFFEIRFSYCDECVIAGQNVFLGPTIHLPLPDYCFESHHFQSDICKTKLFSDAFSKGAVIPICSPRSEFAVTPVASRPEGAFIDLIANSILAATVLSIAIKIAFMDSVFNRVDNITYFPVNLLIKTSFQGFHIHRIFISH